MNVLPKSVRREVLEKLYPFTKNYQSTKIVRIAASRHWPIHDDDTWKHFFPLAKIEYEELHIFLDARSTTIVQPQISTYGGSDAHNCETFHNIHSHDDRPSTRYGGRYNPHIVEQEDDHSTTYEEEDDSDYEQFSGDDDATTNSDNNDVAHDTSWADIELEQPYVEPANRESDIIVVGKIYDSYDSLKEAVAKESIWQNRIFRTFDKRDRPWKAVCIYDEMCTWHIQAGNLLNTNLWRVKKYQPLHNCRVDYKRAPNDRRMTSKFIATVTLNP
ncbi:unnamed protein product [Cuscuta epithymum]|uniref:Transposase MuDR plant domain-containing protein n=1 Tax=Cuscuta epithymum TaxID=186058 RepID=A0AAV0CIL0_9ASTE|nr:unnamed protein product [Cuscuta epithymum]